MMAKNSPASISRLTPAGGHAAEAQAQVFQSEKCHRS